MDGTEAHPLRPRETAGLTTRLIVGYVRARGGDEAVRRMLTLAGLPDQGARLEDEHSWSTYEQKIALFEAAAGILHDPLVSRHIGEEVIAQRVGLPLKLLLRALGSPGQVARNVARAAPKFSQVCTMEALSVDADGAVLTYRLHEGHRPHRMDCEYNIGLISQIPVLFGRPAASVAHVECQVLGAERCVYQVRWQRRLPRLGGRRARIAQLEDQLSTLTERTEALQSTVADMVSTDDVETVLSRIAQRAAAAVRAPQHLLAVWPEDGAPPRVLCEGFDDQEARRLAGELVVDADDAGAAERMVVAVASRRRDYGLLAAINAPGALFFPEERVLLRAYARHAAAALDAATALEQARRQGETARLLLDLARTLADVSTSEQTARRLAEAVPHVAGDARSVVGLWDREGAVLRVVAAHGFGEDATAVLTALTISPTDTPELPLMVSDPRPRWYGPDTTDPFIRALLTTYDSAGAYVVPIASRGEFLGVIIVDSPLDGAQRVTGDIGVRLAGLADQAAVALVNARLLEREREAVARLRESEARVRHQAYHDHLTGLPNRLLLDDRAALAFASARRHGHGAAVLFLDLDHFKDVNDRLGHEEGNRLLRQVADRLRATTRDEDTVARLGGDEFVVLLPRVATTASAETVARSVLEHIREPFTLAGETVRVSASIGVAVFPGDGEDTDALLRSADQAMYRAKQAGRDAYRVSQASSH